MPALQLAPIPMVGSTARPTIGIKYNFVVSMTLGSIPATHTRVARPKEIELGLITLDTTRSGNIRLTIEGQPVIYDLGFLPRINFGTSFGSIQATKSGTHISEDSITLGLTTLTIDKSIGSLDLDKHRGIRSKPLEMRGPFYLGYIGQPPSTSVYLQEIAIDNVIGYVPGVGFIYKTFHIEYLGFIPIINFGMTLGSIQLTNA